MKLENEKLIEQIKSGSDVQVNFEKLYNQNRGFIYKLIKNRVNSLYAIDDLMQQSFIALVNAVNYYNSDLEKNSFLQILKYCIWNELRGSVVQLPAHLQNKIISYRKTYDRLYNILGYKPQNYQIMLEMNISLNELDTIRTAMKQPLSLDEPISEDGDNTRLDIFADSIIDEDMNFDSDLEQRDIKKAVQSALMKLPENAQELIENRYFKSFTLKKCGKEMNISKERVRQIEQKALWKLSHDKELERKLDGYINIYRTVGVSSFNRTHTSSTELMVLEREKLKQNIFSAEWT